MAHGPDFDVSPDGTPRIGTRRIPVPLAAIGGWAALVVALGGFLLAARDGAGPAVWVTVVAGAAGGGVAVWRPDGPGMLAFADGFLTVAVLATVTGFGLLYVLPLLAVLVGTVDTPTRSRGGMDRSALTFAAGPAPRAPRVARRLERLRRAVGEDPTS